MSKNTEVDDENEMKLIAEEYKIWKKNTPFLYDLVLSHALEWPSLTCEWLPDHTPIPDSNFASQHLLLGTLTNSEEQNHLMVVEVKLPYENISNIDNYEESALISGNSGKIEIIQQINVEAEVNRARHMPQQPNIIAIHTGQPDILVFDRNRHPNKAPRDGSCKPDLRLKGHKRQGYGIAWNPQNKGQLVSSADDRLICLFDIEMDTHSGSIEPIGIFYGHTDAVEDVTWHPKQSSIFGTVGDDKKLCIWDTRSKNKRKPTFSCEAHKAETNCITFNPFSDYLLATGSADKTVALWDLRNLDSKLHSFEGHTEQVFNVSWSPFSEVILASGGADRRVNIWDLSKIGAEQSPDDAEDGPPELLFIHGGHTDNISDFCWNSHLDWCVCSVGDNNVVQIWQIADAIYADEETEEPVPDDSLE